MSSTPSFLPGLLLVVLSLSSLAPSRTAEAQTVAVDQFLPAPDQTGFVGIPSTRTPGPWGVDATMWLGYGFRTLSFDSSSGASDVIKHRLDATLIGQLGIGGRVALALRLPALLTQKDELPALGTAAPFNLSLASRGVGNPALDARVRVFGAAVRADGSADDGTAIALRGVVHAPVGTRDAYFADENWRTELAAIVDVEAFGLGAGAQLSWRHTYQDADPTAAGSVAFTPRGGDQLRLAAGLKVPLPLVARALPGQVQETALIELDVGISPDDNAFDGDYTPFEGRLSYRIVVGDVALSLGGGAAFTGAGGAADARAWFGVSYSPRKHDQDADGVPDTGDQCAHLAEDGDGFEDQDGCPEPDNDQDMILDEDDRCPLEPAEIDRDEDEDGCTDR